MVAILLPRSGKLAPLSASDNSQGLMESFRRITIVGWVSCGHPIDMLFREEEIEVPSKLVRKNNYALRLRDDSMKEAYIIDGDIVIIEQTEVAENSGNVVFKNQR